MALADHQRRGLWRSVAGYTLHDMKPYILTLIAKHNDDGSYQYSTSIFYACGDGLSQQKSFDNEQEFSWYVNSLFGGPGDLNNVLPRLKREGEFRIDHAIKMSDRQAMQFGWVSSSGQVSSAAAS
jgi:hypothetical protein